MERELPDYGIKGIRFYVDILKGELREIADSTNKIPFAAMRFKGGQYELDFDMATKSMYHGDPAKKPESVITVRIPHPYRLDPDIMVRILEKRRDRTTQTATQTRPVQLRSPKK